MPDHPNSPDHHTRQVWARLGRNAELRDLCAKPDSRFGFDPDRLSRLLTDLDTTEPVGTTLSVCVQVATAIPLLRQANQPAVTEAVLAGDALVAFAATDAAAAGSDLTGLGTTVRLDEDRLTLAGRKEWIVNATTADWAVVLARHAEGRRFTNFSLLLVPLDSRGIRRRPADTTAFAGSGLGDITFDDVELDESCVIDGRGRGLALFARQMAGERLASGLWAAAMAGRALADTRSRLHRRQIADQSLWQHAAVRHRLARAVIHQQLLTALGEQLCRPAESESDTSERTMARAAVLKAAGALTLDHVLAECGELSGADGFRPGGIQDLRREAAMFGIAGGSTATMLDVIADHAGTLVRAAAGGEEP